MKIVFCLLLLGCSACGVLKPFTVESPRPERHQVEASAKVTSDSIPVIVNAQIDKQRQIKLVASAAIRAIPKATSDAQVEALAHLVQDSVDSIEHADGTAKILRRVLGNVNDGIMTQNTAQYLS